MFGFLIKKSFWDLWDNMGRVIVVNLLFTLLLLGYIGAASLVQYSLGFSMILLLILLVITFIYLGTVAVYIKELNDFKSPEFKSLFQNIKNTWRYSVGGSLVFAAIMFLTILGMRFYSSLGGILGMIGAIFLFWIFVTVSLASLYYFPVVTRLNSTFFKMIKKSFLIFLDNPILSIGVFIGMIFNSILSIITLLLIPGPAGVLIWLDNNLRLLIYKYDYMEENPESGRKVPWRVLFKEDNEKIGPRTLRNTIFPWK